MMFLFQGGPRVRFSKSIGFLVLLIEDHDALLKMELP